MLDKTNYKTMLDKILLEGAENRFIFSMGLGRKVIVMDWVKFSHYN